MPSVSYDRLQDSVLVHPHLKLFSVKDMSRAAPLLGSDTRSVVKNMLTARRPTMLIVPTFLGFIAIASKIRTGKKKARQRNSLGFTGP